MTKNVFQALDFINREGLDNSQWGLQSGCSEIPLASKFPVNKVIWGKILCPQSFLYIWIDLATADKLSSLDLKPTRVMYVTDTGGEYREVIFIWELRAED